MFEWGDDGLQALADDDDQTIDAASDVGVTPNDTPYEPLPQPPFFSSPTWDTIDSDLRTAVHAQPFEPLEWSPAAKSRPHRRRPCTQYTCSQLCGVRA